MNAAVFFYSRTGTTRTVGQAVARALDCPWEEILDLTDRSGPKGYLSAGRDAMRKRLTSIGDLSLNPEDAQVVVIGTPVWAFTVAPAVRTFLCRYADRMKKTAFFCTQGGSGGGRTLREMSAVSASEPVATLILTEREVRSGAFAPKVENFAREIADAIR